MDITKRKVNLEVKESDYMPSTLTVKAMNQAGKNKLSKEEFKQLIKHK